MRKIKVLAVIMMIAAMIVGCGSKEVPMKEFASTDGSCTIQLNEKWVVEDTWMICIPMSWAVKFTEEIWSWQYMRSAFNSYQALYEDQSETKAAKRVHLENNLKL